VCVQAKENSEEKDVWIENFSGEIKNGMNGLWKRKKFEMDSRK
jgi:hypothetical protein